MCVRWTQEIIILQKAETLNELKSIPLDAFCVYIRDGDRYHEASQVSCV